MRFAEPMRGSDEPSLPIFVERFQMSKQCGRHAASRITAPACANCTIVELRAEIVSLKDERDRYETGFENASNALDAQIRDDAVVEMERNALREVLRDVIGHLDNKWNGATQALGRDLLDRAWKALVPKKTESSDG